MVHNLDVALKHILKSIPDVRVVYHFGSSLAQNEHAQSDVDLAVFSGKTILDKVGLFELSCDLARILNKDVDVVDLSDASTVFAFQVVSKGAKIYVADFNEIERYEDKIYRLYGVLNDERSGIMADIQKRHLS